MNFDKKISELNINLPKATDPVGSYVATKLFGKMLFVSGQISIDENGNLIKGKLGKDLNTEDGYNAAKRCGLSIVAQVKKDCSMIKNDTIAGNLKYIMCKRGSDKLDKDGNFKKGTFNIFKKLKKN